MHHHTYTHAGAGHADGRAALRMRTAGTLRPSELTFLGGLGAVLTMILAAAWPPFGESFRGDSAIDSAAYALAGDLLRHGGVPYVSYWDHKPPLVHLLNALGLSISGGALWGVWLLTWASLLGAVLLAYLTMRRAFAPLNAALGTVYFALAVAMVMAVNLTEWYALPLQWGAVALCVCGGRCATRSFARGVALGALGTLSFVLRANLVGGAVAAAVVLSVVLLSRRERAAWMRLVAGSAAGVALVAVPLLVYLYAAGAWDEFVEQAFRYNALYVGATMKERLRSLDDGLRVAGFSVVLVLPIAGWLLSAHAVWRRRVLDNIAVLALVWLPIEAVFVSLSGRQYSHYYNLLMAPLAFLTALASRELTWTRAEGEGTSPRPASVPIALLAAILFAGIPRLLYGIRDAAGRSAIRGEYIATAAERIGEETHADESIYVWGHAPDLYLLTGRRPATRFIYPQALLTPGYADSALVRRFIAELDRAQPAVIVDVTGTEFDGGDLTPSLASWEEASRWTYPASGGASGKRHYWSAGPELKLFFDYVATSYAPVDTIQPAGWVVYGRRAPDGTVRLAPASRVGPRRPRGPAAASIAALTGRRRAAVRQAASP